MALQEFNFSSDPFTHSRINTPQKSHAETLQALNVTEPGELIYALSLYKQYLTPSDSQNLIIGENFMPTALMTAEQRRTYLGVVDYKTEVQGKPEYIRAAQQTVFTAMPMDAGLGSSMKREAYLRNLPSEVGRTDGKIGAKGTDLYFPVQATDGTVHFVSTTAIKYIRLLHERTHFGQLRVTEIVNKDSRSPMQRFFESEFISGQTWAQVLEENGITVGEFMEQNDLPCIAVDTGALTTERTAPGGHGQIGTQILHAISDSPNLSYPQARGVVNGDGPNNSFSPEMVGFMVQERAGMVIVTTTRTETDIKVGNIGVAMQDGVVAATIMELAQSIASNQHEIFAALGMQDDAALPQDIKLRHQAGEQLANTNNILFNDTLLVPFLRELKEYLGEEKFAAAITPNLIRNPKKQNGKDFIQLEGAISSCVLNLNRLVMTDPEVRQMWGRLSGDMPFLRFINLDVEARTMFFTPEKYGIDHAIFAHSDHFSLDIDHGVLVNRRPGHIPGISESLAQDPYYADMQHVVESFDDLKILDLDMLDIDGIYIEDPNTSTRTKIGGKVQMAHAELAGVVQIRSSYDGVIDLNSPKSRQQLGQVEADYLKLSNVTLEIDAQGNIRTEIFLIN